MTGDCWFIQLIRISTKVQGQYLAQRLHQASLLSKTSSRMSTTRPQTRSEVRSRTPEQTQQQEESQTASCVHTTETYPANLWTDYEYARKACDRTGARINFVIRSLEFGPEHPHAKPWNKVALPGLLPYLDDYIINAHDPYVEDFVWSMDDNRHTESKSPELTEGDEPNLLLFAEREVINRVRTEAAGSVAQVAGRDARGARAFAQTEIKPQGHQTF